MDISEQSNDPLLNKFDKWLKDSKIESPECLLENVRARLDDPSAQIDRKIDDLFRQDASFFDARMLWKIRSNLETHQPDTHPAIRLSKYLMPLAAAATLTLAVISFQSQGTKVDPIIQDVPALETVTLVDLDDDMTRIFALAANLDGAGNVSELESMEHLSFLFE